MVLGVFLIGASPFIFLVKLRSNAPVRVPRFEPYSSRFDIRETFDAVRPPPPPSQLSSWSSTDCSESRREPCCLSCGATLLPTRCFRRLRPGVGHELATGAPALHVRGRRGNGRTTRPPCPTTSSTTGVVAPRVAPHPPTWAGLRNRCCAGCSAAPLKWGPGRQGRWGSQGRREPAHHDDREGHADDSYDRADDRDRHDTNLVHVRCRSLLCWHWVARLACTSTLGP